MYGCRTSDSGSTSPPAAGGHSSRLVMRLARVVLLALVAVAGGGRGEEKQKEHNNPGAGSPLAATPSGSVRGSWMTSRRGRHIQAYRGIRYAEPPVGELRFQPPKLILHYSEEVNATAEGPACPQPVDLDSYAVDEDCLRLNVYTHSIICSQPRPVVVYMHAGGYYSASGRSDEAGPRILLDHNLVYVAINYRLGSLGFLSTGDALAPGNNGLKDQVAALRWVRRNIAAFCGDPRLVTIAGYSAGSISVALHTLSPMSRGLFHRSRAMSGSPFLQTPTPHHQRHLAERQARAVGCPAHNSSVILDCLRKKSWQELGNSLDSMFELGYDPILEWLPVIEPDVGQERFLEEDPLVSLRQGRMQSVPVMLSQTRDEFFWKAFRVLANETRLKRLESEWDYVASVSFLLPRDNGPEAARALRRAYLGNGALRNDSATARGLGKLYGDAVIGFPVHRMAKLMATHSSQPVYYYMFNYTGNHSFYRDPVTDQPTGVAHHDDLIYLLSLPLVFPDLPAEGSRDARMADTMAAIMYYFAKYGDPNRAAELVPGLARVHWPRMSPDERAYLAVDSELSVHENMFEERFQIWEDLFPLQ